MKNIYYFSLYFFLIIAYSACTQKEQKIIKFKENGSWCWFQDERATIHDNQLIFGSVADRYGKNGEAVDGNIEVTTYDLKADSLIGTFVLHEKLEADDHDAPAFLSLKDGRILSVYCRHNTDSLIRYRISKRDNTMEWRSERVIARQGGVSYSNLLFLQSENDGRGRIYDFYRGGDRTPYYVYSDDQAGSWQAGYHFLTFDKKWPYVKYASDGKGKIHFITTESHPIFWGCSIYHGYFEDNKIYNSAGILIRDLAQGPVQPTELIKIFQGDSLHNAWTIDIELDKKDMPYVVYSVRNNVDHIQYRFARWDGGSWNDHFLAYAGRALYEVEKHYSGLAALDPDDPDVVYISTDADPVTESPLISEADHVRHYEIFRGKTSDSGKTWIWKPLTENSMQDNVRPIMPKGNRKYKALLWLRGSIKSYQDYNFDVVGLINP